MRPLNKNILVKPHDIKEETDTGLIITRAVKEKPSEGTVLSMAEDCTLKIKVGDVLVYNKFAGMFFDEYLILNEEEIMGVKE